MLTHIAQPLVPLQYLREMLRDGNALANASLKLPLAYGQLDVCLPEANASAALTSLTRPEQWYWSRGIHGDAAWEEAADIAGDYLERDPAHCLVIEDFLAAPTDPVLITKAHPPFMALNGHLYYVLSPCLPHSYADYRNQMLSALRWALSFRLIAWLIEAPFWTEPTNEQSLESAVTSPRDTQALINQIVATTRCLIVSAFDSESFLLWRR